MLRDLIATIETLKERIKEHRSYLGQVAPEARTRVSLIDPMLQALEWGRWRSELSGDRADGGKGAGRLFAEA